jgi:hypothetical protein
MQVNLISHPFGMATFRNGKRMRINFATEGYNKGEGTVAFRAQLADEKCPVCREVADTVQGHRDYGRNGGIVCDTNSGPCSCGAWH